MKHSLLVIFVLILAGASILALPTSAETPSSSGETGSATPPSEIVAYYFHGHMRCATCRKIEAYSEEAITKGFTDELASGQLEWRVVNTDISENEHFVTDFELVTKSVVLVEYQGGKVERFENLNKVWKLVGDKDGFITYVRNETHEFIGKN